MGQLIGIGIYTPSEASRLLAIPAGKISRWLKGHSVGERKYKPLWSPEIILDNEVYLGFRDLMEIRVADAFIRMGLSAYQVRKSIEIAREYIGQSHPLSTNRFRTDGRDIFLQVIEADENGVSKEQLLNLFRRQYEFKEVLEPLLKTVQFGSKGEPLIWWPKGRIGRIVIDPKRSFGQPIEETCSIPTSILNMSASNFGIEQTASVFDISEAAVSRASAYEASLHVKIAA
jgi:uncharacterized protein (DUF433 family)